MRRVGAHADRRVQPEREARELIGNQACTGCARLSARAPGFACRPARFSAARAARTAWRIIRDAHPIGVRWASRGAASRDRIIAARPSCLHGAAAIFAASRVIGAGASGASGTSPNRARNDD